MAGEYFELPYLRTVTRLNKTKFGYPEIAGCEQYKGVYIRNRVVVRLDILSAFKEFFTAEFLDEHRSAVYVLMSGNISDSKTVSEVMSAFYLADTQFKKYLGMLYYFDDRIYKTSMYTMAICDFKAAYEKYSGIIYKGGGIGGYKVLFESCGYMYIAVRDEVGKARVPAGFKEEVLSYGKLWSGDFERYEPEAL